jgi:hypothetical protein
MQDNPMTSELTPTSGKAWREGNTVVLRLPSGRIARVRAVGPDVILRNGSLPDSLTGIIAQIMEGGGEVPKPSTLDDLRGMADFMNVVTQSAFVEPRVVETPAADDEIGLDDIDWPDKEFLMGVVGASTRALESFRDEQAGDVGAVVSPEGHAPPGEPDPGDQPVGAGDDGA